MTRRGKLAICSFVLFLTLTPASTVRAENWPHWRGPNRNGISDESAPVKWNRTINVRWRLALPGKAGATPVVWGDRIFLTSADGKDLVLLCVSTSGKELWKRTIGSGNKNVRGNEGNYASPSPSTDGEHVWTFMGNGLMACHDFAGEEVWAADLQERYGKFEIQFGLSSTPVLDGDRLYLQLIHGKWGDPATSRGHVIALDKKTGKEVWRQTRETDAIDECKHSYASPILYRDDERSFLVTHGADFAIAYSLDEGREIWRCGNLNPKERYVNTLRFVASPAAAEGLIVIPTAKGGKVVAVNADSKGDVTNSKSAVRWVLPRLTPDVPSPLIHDGLVYLCRENGVLMLLDAKTGEKIYEKRSGDGIHRASPVYADGKIYTTSRRGIVTVVKAGRDFEILTKNDMGEDISASPAISNGVLYLRSYKALYAIGKGK